MHDDLPAELALPEVDVGKVGGQAGQAGDCLSLVDRADGAVIYFVFAALADSEFFVKVVALGADSTVIHLIVALNAVIAGAGDEVHLPAGGHRGQAQHQHCYFDPTPHYLVRFDINF